MDNETKKMNLGSFDEALKKLDDAVVTHTAPMPSISESLSGLTGLDTVEIERWSSHAMDQFTEARSIVQRIQKNIRTQPWPWIAGAAVGAFAIGFVIAQSAKTESEEARG